MFKQTSQEYLNWEEYVLLIAQKERLAFIHETAKKSIENYWKKREVLSKWI